MSWFHYVGSHVHNFCDTDNGYFLEGGKGEQLLPGREIRYRCECTVPSAGEYTLQFDWIQESVCGSMKFLLITPAVSA